MARADGRQSAVAYLPVECKKSSVLNQATDNEMETQFAHVGWSNDDVRSWFHKLIVYVPLSSRKNVGNGTKGDMTVG